jgi:hypothetical protein
VPVGCIDDQACRLLVPILANPALSVGLHERYESPRTDKGWRTLVRSQDGSVLDCLDTTLLEALEAVLHGLELFSGVPFPLCDLARDPQWIPRAV